jgi:hypothetical protein
MFWFDDDDGRIRSLSSRVESFRPHLFDSDGLALMGV